MDDVLYHTVSTTAANQSELHQPHFLLLSLSIGGWAGNPNTTSVFPMRYDVDYVRVYARASERVNLIRNPGLEDGSTSWNGVRGSWAISQRGAGNTYAGTWAFKVETTQQYGSGTGPYQTVSGLTANTTSTARFWLKGTGRVHLVVNKSQWGGVPGTARCNASSSWTPCTVTFNTGTGTSVIVQLQDHRAGTAYVDDLFLGVP